MNDTQIAIFAVIQTVIGTLLGYIFRNRQIKAEANLTEAKADQVNSESDLTDAKAEKITAETLATLIGNIAQFSELIRDERQESRAMSARIRELEETARTERKALQEQVDGLAKQLADAETRHNKEIVELKKSHSNEIQALKEAQVAEIQILREDMKRTHDSDVDSLKTKHRDELVRMELNHGVLVKELQAQLEKANEQIAFLTGELEKLKQHVEQNESADAAAAHKAQTNEGGAGESVGDPSTPSSNAS